MATSQGASLCVYLKLQLWCQVSIALPYYSQRYSWFCVLTSYCNHWWRHQLSNLHNAKTWISLEWEKILQKGKHHSSSLLRTFQMRLNCFLLHRHFNGSQEKHLRYTKVSEVHCLVPSCLLFAFPHLTIKHRAPHHWRTDRPRRRRRKRGRGRGGENREDCVSNNYKLSISQWEFCDRQRSQKWTKGFLRSSSLPVPPPFTPLSLPVPADLRLLTPCYPRAFWLKQHNPALGSGVSNYFALQARGPGIENDDVL